jgi:hypothetical protein
MPTSCARRGCKDAMAELLRRHWDTAVLRVPAVAAAASVGGARPGAGPDIGVR